MAGRASSTTAAPLFAAAALSYVANCALGTAVALKLVDTRGFRWVHHALYITTCAAFVTAVSTVRWSGPRNSNDRAALMLMPAAVPLTAIAFVKTRNRWHPLVALAAAPFIAAGLVCSLHPADRK